MHLLIIHNPTSGDQEYSRKKLEALVEAAGHSCTYFSSKDEDWKKLDIEADALVVAGGDGTVRKVVKQLMNRKLKERSLPIVLFPLGTANNIADTLGVKGLSPEEVIAGLSSAVSKCYDVGKLYNLEDDEFFMESFGFGIFPFLIKKMKKRSEDEKSAEAEEELKAAINMLYDVVSEYEPRECTLQVDGSDHSGKFILAEIMNIKSIGPRLELAPTADPGDGEFEVVLIPEAHKSKFMAFVGDMKKGANTSFAFHTLRGRNIKIQWQGTHVHIDDKILKIEENAKVEVEMKRSIIEFLVPVPKTGQPG